MKLRVRLFALARQLAGRDDVEVEIGEPATVAQLRQQLAADVPALAGLLPYVHIAVGTDYARDDAEIPAGSDVACIPPVSGG